jgi:hypothetical protein
VRARARRGVWAPSCGIFTLVCAHVPRHGNARGASRGALGEVRRCKRDLQGPVVTGSGGTACCVDGGVRFLFPNGIRWIWMVPATALLARTGQRRVGGENFGAGCMGMMVWASVCCTFITKKIEPDCVCTEGVGAETQAGAHSYAPSKVRAPPARARAPARTHASAHARYQVTAPPLRCARHFLTGTPIPASEHAYRRQSDPVTACLGRLRPGSLVQDGLILLVVSAEQ